jgi:hypothetical protein
MMRPLPKRLPCTTPTFLYEIETLEVLFFSTRLLRQELFELPVVADLRLPA